MALALAELPAAVAARQEHERNQPKWDWWRTELPES